MVDELQTTGRVAKALGISEALLQSLLRRRPELKPATLMGGRRLWTAPEIEALRAARRASRKPKAKRPGRKPGA